MALYFQWKSKHPENKLLYYICGAEQSLCLEVRDAVVTQWTSTPECCMYTVACSGDNFPSAESAVLMETQKLKIVVLTHAERLSQEQKVLLETWAWAVAEGRLSQTVLIVHTTEDNPETSQSLYRPFVEKGRFVECKAMSVDSMKKYAIVDYRCTEEAADVLCELVSYNFMKMNNELEKLACLALPVIDVAVVREYVVFSADDLFVQNMLQRNKAQALKVVSAVPMTSVTQVLAYMAKKLAFLYLMIQADAPGTNAHKLAAILGVQPWQLLEFFSIKKFWNGQLILEKLNLLTQIESNYSKYSTNILPLLVSWW